MSVKDFKSSTLQHNVLGSVVGGGYETGVGHYYVEWKVTRTYIQV